MPIFDWKSSRRNVFWPLRQNLDGTVSEEFDLESKILCPRHLSGASASVSMIAVICHKVVIVYKAMGRETGFFFHFVFFFPLVVIWRQKSNS